MGVILVGFARLVSSLKIEGKKYMEFALRVAESTAFAIHCVMAVTEPLHGGLTSALGVKRSLPPWFFPVGGVLLGLVAVGNFSGDDTVVLACQGYTAAWHAGGSLFHIRLNHHPAAAGAPFFFVVIAFAVTSLRAGLAVAVPGLVVCLALAVTLTPLLVTPPRAPGTKRSSSAKKKND